MPRSHQVRVAGRVPATVFLYEDPSTERLDEAAIATYIGTTLGLSARVRRDFIAHHFRGDPGTLAERIAAARVRRPDRPPEVAEPVPGEVAFELRRLEEPTRPAAGVLYDAHRLAAVYRELLPRRELTLRIVHVVMTSRLFGTFEDDGRYHARANLCGFPSFVSTSGIVEGPARPKAYYQVKARVSMALGSVPFEAVKEPFRGTFIDYDDARLTDVAKGYVLQCVLYHITGEAFCEDPRCRLFNAHWQSELLAAQVESGAMCDRHAALAASIRTIARAGPRPRKT